MTSFSMPITLATAAALTLIYAVTIFRIGSARGKSKVWIGDGGDATLLNRMRTQANFVEYVPLTLILMALLEQGGANPTVLSYGGGALVVCRILHIIGMPSAKPNVARGVGAMGTFIVMIGAAVWAIVSLLA